MNSSLNLTNRQGWTIGGNVSSLQSLTLKDRSGKSYKSDKIFCTWNGSGDTEQGGLSEQLNELRNLSDTHKFEVVRKGDKAFLVLDQGFLNKRNMSLFLGGVALLTGCALTMSGVGLPASILMNAGFGGAFDAYSKNAVDFSIRGNFKQILIGGIAGAVMSGFQAMVFPPAAALFGKVFQACSTNLLGYSTVESLNNRDITVNGVVFTALSGGATPLAGGFSANI